NRKVKIEGHVTVESTYRLLITDVLPQYDKVIYIDSDLVINKDIAELYKQDIGDNLIGAVRHVVDGWLQNYLDTKLLIPYEDYFNAGVLIINTKQLAADNIMEKCIELLCGDTVYRNLDQDALNIMCRGKTCFLDDRWNVCWQFCFQEPIQSYKDIFIKAAEQPYITHFTSQWKPWRYPDREMANFFWKYARQTVFYEEILYKNLDVAEMQANAFKMFLFPFDKIPRGSNIVLYAAGGVGKAYYQQNKITGYCNVLLWVDKNYKVLQKEGIPVYSPEKIHGVPYDYILIAIDNETIADSIKKFLLDMGEQESKIIWANPYK
ncbi:MAG: glycosyltransferase family 8 protein, partial [Acetivibrionales bacterium]